MVALLVALRRPELVGRLVLIGQYYNSSGKAKEGAVLKMIDSAEAMVFLPLEYDGAHPTDLSISRWSTPRQ